MCFFLTYFCIPFVSAKSDKPVQNLSEVCSRPLLSQFHKLKYGVLCFIVTIRDYIYDKHISKKMCAPVIHEHSFRQF